MEIRSLIPMVGDGPNRFLIESLNYSNSQILTIQHRDFHKALGGKGDSEVFCFYETLQSPTAQQVSFIIAILYPITSLIVTRINLATGK